MELFNFIKILFFSIIGIGLACYVLPVILNKAIAIIKYLINNGFERTWRVRKYLRSPSPATVALWYLFGLATLFSLATAYPLELAIFNLIFIGFNHYLLRAGFTDLEFKISELKTEAVKPAEANRDWVYNKDTMMSLTAVTLMLFELIVLSYNKF